MTNRQITDLVLGPQTPLPEYPYSPSPHQATTTFKTLTIALSPECAFTPEDEYLEIQHISVFPIREEYPLVLAHELIHWTALHVPRQTMADRGYTREQYLIEEIIAEVGALLYTNDVTFAPHTAAITAMLFNREYISLLLPSIITQARKAQKLMPTKKEFRQLLKDLS